MIKQFVSRVIRNKIFCQFWKKFNFLSYFGMNFGVASVLLAIVENFILSKKLKY